MANPFRDMSVFIQGLVAVALAFIILLLGVYVPLSPVAQERDAFDKAVLQRSTLNTEVQQLQVYKQRYGELKQQMDALSKQLDTLKTIVPEEKETDEFIRLIQGAASSSNVTLRRLTAQAIVPREFHYEMPFEVQADGPYFNLMDGWGGCPASSMLAISNSMIRTKPEARSIPQGLEPPFQQFLRQRLFSPSQLTWHQTPLHLERRRPRNRRGNSERE
jgi:Tfp pilus assembly protein PilO